MQTDAPAISPAPFTPELLDALDKFMLMADDLPEVCRTSRRVLFEFLRAGNQLTPTEASHLHALSEFLADCSESRNR